MKPEFKKDDIVHFRPYRDRAPIKARVVEVKEGGYMFDFGLDGYKLEGIDKPLASRTNGKSIVESKHYELIDAKDAFKD